MKIELNAQMLTPTPPTGVGAGQFGQIVTQQLEQANKLQQKSGELVQAYASGEDIDVHRMMIAAEEARLSMDFVLQVRNKLIDAYQEMMRMQI